MQKKSLCRCYFDALIYCNRIATVAILITLPITVLLSMFIILCVHSISMAYVLLKFITLNSISLNSPIPCPLETTILLSGFMSLTLLDSTYMLVFSLTYLTYHNVLRFHRCCCKWQDILLSHG